MVVPSGRACTDCRVLPRWSSGRSGGGPSRSSRTSTSATSSNASGVTSTLPRPSRSGPRPPSWTATRAGPDTWSTGCPRHSSPRTRTRSSPSASTSPTRDRAGRQGAGHHRAGAAHVERPVHPEPDVALGIRHRHRGQYGPESAERRSSRPGPGPPADHHGRAPGQRRAAHLVARRGRGPAPGRPGRTRVTATTPWRTPSASSAARCSAACGIHGSSAATTSIAAGTGPEPGERGRQEPLVARHVHERDVADRIEVGPAVAELDRQPAPVLLLEPVGVLPGQRPDQRGLAVVDMTRGGDDVHLRPRRPGVRRRRGRRPARPAP